MKIEFHFYSDTDELSHVSFSGLTGSESCFTLKEAVNKLQIENPAKTFADRYKSGGYEHMSEALIARDAELCNAISELWKYTPEDELLPSMNVLQLLANSLRLNANLLLKLSSEEDED